LDGHFPLLKICQLFKEYFLNWPSFRPREPTQKYAGAKPV
jgi:hypothetical protein